MRRRKRRNRHWGLLSLLLLLVVIAAVTLFLIHRGAKVQGPDQSSSGKTSVIDTTPTHVSGTYAGQGDATDPDGESLTVQVYIQLKTHQRFNRELQIQGDSTRMIVDSGTYTRSGNKLTLSSTSAVVFQYSSAANMQALTPRKKTRYGGRHTTYPDYLITVLNDTVTLRSGTPQTYHYNASKLRLAASDESIPTVAGAIAEQAADTSSASSTWTQSATSASSDTADPSSSDTSTATSSSSSRALITTVSQAKALVVAQYPTTDYTVTATGESSDTFTFVVINNDTHANQTVTVTAAGNLQ